MTHTIKQTLGAWGEQLAADWLVRRGYVILERNYSCPSGEIDIVARYGDSVSFIEVKTRSGNNGSAERSVGFYKQQHVARAARYFCRARNYNLLCTSILFEQISVYCDTREQCAHIIKYILP